MQYTANAHPTKRENTQLWAADWWYNPATVGFWKTESFQVAKQHLTSFLSPPVSSRPLNGHRYKRVGIERSFIFLLNIYTFPHFSFPKQNQSKNLTLNRVLKQDFTFMCGSSVRCYLINPTAFVCKPVSASRMNLEQYGNKNDIWRVSQIWPLYKKEKKKPKTKKPPEQMDI